MTTHIPFRGSSVVAPAVTVLLALLAVPATADPIVIPVRITGGTVEVTPGLDRTIAEMRLVGTGGFGLSAAGVSTVCEVCFSGDTVGLPGFVSLFGGGVELPGHAADERIVFVVAGGELDFNAPGFTLPITSDDPVVFRTAFTMSGDVRLPVEPFVNGLLSGARFTVTGGGTAEATFLPRGQFPGLGQEFVFSSAVFQFTDAAPTPEPATMLLMGAGLLGARSTRRRSR